MCDKKLPAETVRVILLPAKTFSRKQNRTVYLCRKLSIADGSLERKQEIEDSLSGNQI